MIGIVIAVLVAALVYWLCLVLGLPVHRRHRRRDPRPRSAAWGPAATGCVRAGASSPPVEHSAPDRHRVGRAPLRRVVVRAVKNFLAHQMTDRAATLTYYAMMSLFPALLVGVTLLGLVGQQGLVTDATNYLVDHGVDRRAPRTSSARSCRTWSAPRAERWGRR